MKKLKDYVKLNESEYHLSLGSLFKVIKEESNAKNTFLQSELFCDIFEINSIADSTVNNYVTGFRAINSNYKEKIIKKKYIYQNENNSIFVPVLYKILSLLENKLLPPNKNTGQALKFINSNKKLILVSNRLYSIAKNDLSISYEFIEILNKKLSTSNIYEFLVEVLLFVIIDKKQPVYIEEEIINSIDNSIKNTKISLSDVNDFINIELHESMWGALRAQHTLANQNNPFACLQMAFYEFHGIVSGKPRYVKSYNYFKLAANKNHPAAIWAIGFMYYKGYIGEQSPKDYKKAFRYFYKAMKLGSSAALNSIGLVFLHGKIPHIKKDLAKAMNYFNLAISKNNVFALNNLGLIYEKAENYEKAFELYQKASEKNESWASNKLGEFYRTGKFVKSDMEKAFYYYTKAINDAIFDIPAWAQYNLAKYFYKNGNAEAGVEKNLNKAIELLQEASEILINANIELIYVYYKKYLNSNKQDEEALKNMKKYRRKLEENPKVSNDIIHKVEYNLMLMCNQK